MTRARAMWGAVSVLLAASIMPGSTAAGPAKLLDEGAARAKAISILQGNPYGDTAAAVKRNIKSVELRSDGKTKACGRVKGAMWEVHVVVDTGYRDQFKRGVIDGYLALDAKTGHIRCSNLPLLD